MAQSVDDSHRAVLMDALDSGDLDRVRNACRRLLAHAVSPTRAAKVVRSTVANHPPQGLKPIRIALLSSFSIELIDDALVAHAYTEGLDVSIYHPGFDQYHQQILDDNSGLYQAAPDVVVLAVDGARWAPQAYGLPGMRTASAAALVDAAVAEVQSLLSALRRRTGATVLLHTLSYPSQPALGIIDATLEYGQRRVISDINTRLAGLAREVGGVYLVDVDAVVASLGHDVWHDPRLAFFARSPIARSAMDALARLYLRYLRSLTGFTRKCLVVDLDDTLWGGILGEAGPRGIAVGSEYPGSAFAAFQRGLRALHDRGVLLAIASKNNLTDVEQAFTENTAMVLRLEDFAAREIHWEPKSVSLRRIADTLNIGLRHIVFADDNPAECAEVAAALPAVTTIELPPQPERFTHELQREGLFDQLAYSHEDARRTALYEQRQAAEDLRQNATSLDEFYRGLEMRAYLEPVRAANIARAAQMTQKTTQFNTTTRLYTEADLTRRLADERWTMIVMRLCDRFGDNGVVGLLLAERIDRVCRIDTLLVSCRVINRGAETCLLHWLTTKARAEGVTSVEGSIIPTARNVPVRDVYERHGFTAVETTDAETKWELNLTSGAVDAPRWIDIAGVTTA